MRNYQPSQQFLDMKTKHDMLKKDTDGGLEKYFTFLSSEWRRIKEDNPEFGVKEVQESAWMEWTKGKEVLREKKVKKVVDPAAPKKPLTAFFLFQKKMRKGGLAMKSTALADMWKEMDDENKKLYKQEEMEMKKKYVEEVMKYKKGKEEGNGECDA